MTALWLLAVPPVLALLIALINAFTWTRGKPAGPTEDLSVCIPARNEIATIEQVVRAALASNPMEVVVCNDNSTDGTGEALARIAAEDTRLRVFNAPPLPVGWVGKVRACHLLARHARGNTLVFVDADTTLLSGGLSRVADLLTRYRAGIVTAVPRQEVRTPMERLVVPLLHVTYTAWLPLALVWLSRDPRFMAANGQILGIRRDTLDAIGGFEAIRDQVVDDMALCRRAKTGGHRVVFADGHHIASCRMYGSAREVWEGFSKNIFEGLGESVPALIAASLLYISAFVLPYALLPASLLAPSLLPVALTGLAATLTLRLVLAVRHGHPLSSVVMHPVGILVLIAIAWNSMRWSRSGQIRWAGRVYPRLSARDPN